MPPAAGVNAKEAPGSSHHFLAAGLEARLG